MRKVLLGVFALVTSATFAASAPATEHSAAAAGGEILFGGTIGAASTTAANVTIQGNPIGVSFGASVGYMRLLMPNIQVGLRGNTSMAASAFVAWNAMLWADYNLDEKLSDSIFIGLGAGLSGGPIAFNAAAEVGKRFELLHNLTWRPTLEVTHSFTTGANWVFNLNLVNLSYLW